MVNEVVVYLSSALICFAGQCYPALVGNNTPTGEFPMTQTSTSLPGYGGDVMVFKSTPKGDYSIHRVYSRRPAQRRIERLHGDTPMRIGVTMGCVNVMPAVYNKMVECCSAQPLKIVE